MSSEGSFINRLPPSLRKTDIRLIATMMVGLYGLYTVFTVLTFLTPLVFSDPIAAFINALTASELIGALVSNLVIITFWTALYAMMALALNLHWGYTGLFNIGVAGYMAVGVYTFAALTVPPSGSPPGLGLPLWVGIIGGMVATAIVGVLTALPALRLRADYLAIVTVGLSEIIRVSLTSETLEQFTLFSNLGFIPDVTLGSGGGRGITMPVNPELPIRGIFYSEPGSAGGGGLTAFGDFVFGVTDIFGVREPVVVSFAYTVLLVVVVALFYWLLVRVGNSPFGRILKAIREDEIVASSLGKDTRLVKIKVFALGCALMGLGGILWAARSGFTSPSVTTLKPLQTFYIFIALIIGGAGSNTGSVLGGAFFASLLFQGPLFVSRIVSGVLNIGTAPRTFHEAVAPLLSADIAPFLAYALENIASLRFVFLGAVLIYVMQNRPTGMLGHRKEVAASVDLMTRSDDPGGGNNE
jgi:ABC-type branched-subunit amino acid transport system permease subunit